MKDEIHRTIEQQFDWIEETEQYIGIQKLKLSLELQECTIRTRTLKAISKYIELSKHGATDESLRAKGAAEGYRNEHYAYPSTMLSLVQSPPGKGFLSEER